MNAAIKPGIDKAKLDLSLVLLVLTFLVAGCSGGEYKSDALSSADSIFNSVPPQPGEDEWKFMEDLQSPLWTKHAWQRKKPEVPSADLSQGVTILSNFPDPDKRLETAYADLENFLRAGDIMTSGGIYMIESSYEPSMSPEEFIIDIDPGKCTIKAADTEGVRRGIFHLEDHMLRLRGPFLPLGKFREESFIKRRISRCFFGPIKRFPKMRDELMDNVNYYPDEYLNRLAHEGVNGLWLTVEFRDLVSTDFTPDAGKDSEKRLAKLRNTVEQCLRYGIRTYIFTIEPRAWGNQPPAYSGQEVIDKYPELGGVKRGNVTYFCPSGESGRKYLYQAVNNIFKEVPGLGGLINISYGERGTTCLSTLASSAESDHNIDCPRCKNKKPWEILHASLSAMEKGMHDAAPDAELISWLYIPHPQRYVTGDPVELASWIYELPAHTPKGVILQYNFESGVSRTEFGKLLVGGDYWISNPGPSARFERIARVASENNTMVSAKIQTGNSHEVATVPYVPVPSLLYRKFSEMRDLGVTHTMLCWYFGNYPGLMNKAAGLLSREPFPSEEDFLEDLAGVYWKEEDVAHIVRAWKLFSKGYENYPLVNLFQYYGPVHDGPVWPLFINPEDKPLSPSWQIGSSATLKPWPPSGDRVGECIGPVLTLDETVELMRRMSELWDSGLKILDSIKVKYNGEPERLKDICLADALSIQIRSAFNILNFYSLREKMLRMEGRQRLDLLTKMEDIISEEIELDNKLIELCENDSRLGFHSEAEGYKYYPDKLKWRIHQLEQVLENDVPLVRKMIRRNELLYPEYTGTNPKGPVAQSFMRENLPDTASHIWQAFSDSKSGSSVRWTTMYDKDSFYILFFSTGEQGMSDLVRVKVEPRRLMPVTIFEFDKRYDRNTDPVHITGYPLLYKGGISEISAGGMKYDLVRIPFKSIGLHTGHQYPLRINVQIQSRSGTSSWIKENPSTSRLILGTENPEDLGWVIFN